MVKDHPMIEALHLFDEPALTGPAPQRCSMCARPARWNAVQRRHEAYCSGKHCSNPERICQTCTEPFLRNVGEAGNKFCSLACKRQGYGRAQRALPNYPACAWCEKPSAHPVKRTPNAWPYLCADCFDPLAHLAYSLKKHHVPISMVKRLLTDPGCEVCGTDIVTRYRNPATGRTRARLHVDHDHRCCPGSYSCGRCVRGLLCDRCNIAAGMLGESYLTAEKLCAYLAR